MHPIPGGLRTDRQPPMAIPLCHFVVAMAFLLVGVVGGTLTAPASLPGAGELAHVHVFLVGWICLTIAGAMTQFVPVWSGVAIHSRRLAVVQLVLVAVGLVGFVGVLLAGTLAYLPLVATPLVAGIWVFVYNIGRTLARARPLDVTERHFAFALWCFATLAPAGFLLAVDFTTPTFDSVPLVRTDVVFFHVTLAVFGAVLSTIVGALYQLAAMFTQVSLTSFDRGLQRLETALFPTGVLVFAIGRATAVQSVARVGALCVLVGVLLFVAVVARTLSRSTVERTPMTARYRIVVWSLLAWTVLAVPTWWRGPVDYTALLGHPDSRPLLLLGVFSFVIVGTLYHVIPFVVWLECYSDRLGFEPVPTIDDLYSSRVERADFAATLVGFLGIATAPLLSVPSWISAAGGVLLAVGFALFVGNVASTIHRHGPGGLRGLLWPGRDTDPDEAQAEPGEQTAVRAK